jgi:site-specific DNA-methyltransferase (adenine-specific)
VSTPQVITGDCRRDLAAHGPFDALIVDPPYGDTSLVWDHRCDGWIDAASRMLKPTGSMWVFGSMRFFQQVKFGAPWRFAQDLVWEKHNGSGFHADRFRRVHEHVCQYYLGSWSDVYNEVQTTADAVARTVWQRRRGPPHTGHIGAGWYKSEDGGPRIMRSVIFMRSRHGRAINPTEKPSDLIEILIRTSCPPGGIVGDLFAGSGAAGEAALRAGRRYVGCEIDPAMAAKATGRLGELLPLTT